MYGPINLSTDLLRVTGLPEQIVNIGGISDESPRAALACHASDRMAAEGLEMARTGTVPGYGLLIMTVQYEKKYGKVWSLDVDWYVGAWQLHKLLGDPGSPLHCANRKMTGPTDVGEFPYGAVRRRVNRWHHGGISYAAGTGGPTAHRYQGRHRSRGRFARRCELQHSSCC